MKTTHPATDTMELSSKPENNSAMPFGQVRDNHYIFSHFALRQFAQADPLKFFSLMPTESAAEAMLDLWVNVNRDCGNPDSADLDFGDIYWHPVAINEHACVVVQMPKPQAPTEAWFSASVLMENLHDDEPFSNEPRVRHLTLQHAPTQENPTATALGEWVNDRYFDHGTGPKADLHSFVRHLEGFIDYTNPAC